MYRHKTQEKRRMTNVHVDVSQWTYNSGRITHAPDERSGILAVRVDAGHHILLLLLLLLLLIVEVAILTETAVSRVAPSKVRKTERQLGTGSIQSQANNRSEKYGSNHLQLLLLLLLLLLLCVC